MRFLQFLDRRWLLLILTILISLLMGVYSSAQEDRSVITVERFRRLLLEQRAAVKSLQVTYESTLTFDPILKARGMMNATTTYEKRTVAIKGNKRFSRTVTKGFAAKGENVQQEYVCVYTGTDCRKREGQILHIQAEKSLLSEANSYKSMLLWPSTYVDEAACQKMPAECPFLPYCLQDPGWSVRQERQTGEGVPRVVLENRDGSRRIWLDPSRGFALISRQFENPWVGIIRSKYEYHDHVKVLPGLYLPKRVTGVLDYDDPQEKRGKFLGSTRIDCRVLKLDVNDVPDSLFVLEPLRGETVIDSQKRIVYTHLDANDKTLQESAQMARTAMQYRSESTSVMRNLMIAINIITAMAIASLLAARWYTARRKKPKQPQSGD